MTVLAERLTVVLYEEGGVETLVAGDAEEAGLVVGGRVGADDLRQERRGWMSDDTDAREWRMG